MVLSFALFMIFAIHGSVTLFRSVRSSVTEMEPPEDYYEMDCSNSYDDDGDGDTDCDDSDCSALPECMTMSSSEMEEYSEMDCENSYDDDGDGDTDCDDSDCSSDMSCGEMDSSSSNF